MSRKAPPSARPGVEADNVKKWVQDGFKEEAKGVFAQHTKETSNLDVLTRCKKLNELLSSDVLKGKGDSKAQLKEILGLLHAPKRPSPLDKPSITGSVGRKPSGDVGSAPDRQRPPPELDPDRLLGLLEDEGGKAASRSKGAPSAGPRSNTPEDVDDLISLLNGDSTLARSAASSGAQQQQQQQQAASKAQEDRARQERAAKEQQERERQRKEAEEAERRKRQQEEDKRRQEEEKRRQSEALKLERLRKGAAVCIQAAWRGHCGRKLAAQRRAQRQVELAAACLQAAWRCRCVMRQYGQRVAAASALQCAVRAWRARRRLQLLRVEAFRRQHAARAIQQAWRYWKTRGYTLGPLRVPARPGSAGALDVDSAALLGKQLRLRGAMDTRLAPEYAPDAGPKDDAAEQHRTVVTHRERVRQVSASERTKRSGVGERTTMAASEHRDTAEALAIARQGTGTLASAGPGPGSGSAPGSRPGSGTRPAGSAGSRPGSGPSERPPAPVPRPGGPMTAPGTAEGAAAAALRPPSSLRKALSSGGGQRTASPAPGSGTGSASGTPRAGAGPGTPRAPAPGVSRAR